MQLNEVSNRVKDNISVAIFFQGNRIAEAKPDSYGYIHIELVNLKLPSNRKAQVFTARVSNSNVEAISEPFSLEFIHSDTKSNFKRVMLEILNWIDDNIISNKKRNITIGIFTLGVWFAMLLWIFIITKTLKGVFKIL